MPEGDTVFRQCRRLDDALAGGTITRSDLRVPALAETDLRGWTVREVVPRGKHLLMRLDPPPALAAAGRAPLTLHSHLMMDGIWRVDGRSLRASDAYSGPRETHTVRAVIDVGHPDGRACRAEGYDIKQVRLVRERDEDELVGHLGPDLLDPAWDAARRARAVENLAARPERPVGLALLDQRNLAGIGNIYRCELCFLLRIHPARPIGELTDPGQAVDLAHRLLTVNRDRTVRVTTGGMMGRRDGDLWVYAREGRPCRRCGTRIERGELDEPELAGTEPRIISFCPHCQVPPPGATGPSARGSAVRRPARDPRERRPRGPRAR